MRKIILASAYFTDHDLMSSPALAPLYKQLSMLDKGAQGTNGFITYEEKGSASLIQAYMKPSVAVQLAQLPSPIKIEGFICYISMPIENLDLDSTYQPGTSWRNARAANQQIFEIDGIAYFSNHPYGEVLDSYSLRDISLTGYATLIAVEDFKAIKDAA